MTNANSIARRYGDETDDWIGAKLELYGSVTTFGGKEVDCIRIRPALPPEAEGHPANAPQF